MKEKTLLFEKKKGRREKRKGAKGGESKKGVGKGGRPQGGKKGKKR